MSKIPIAFFIFILAFFSIGFFYILFPFITAIFLAFILAFLFKKANVFFVRKTNSTLGPFLTTFLMLLTVILPFLLVILLISFEANKNYSFFAEKINQGYVILQGGVENIPLVKELLEFPLVKENLGSFTSTFDSEKIIGYINQGLAYLITLIRDSALDLGELVISFLLILYMFYFISKDYEKIKESLYSFIPLKLAEKNHFFGECKKIIEATVLGVFLIAVMEGGYGMLLFFILQIPSPVTWGVVMIVFSMLPVLGTNTIIVPLLLYKMVTGEYLVALILLVFGVGVILLSQNLIKPKLVGDKSGLHPAIVAMSSLGGLVTFGMIGILIGPLCATLFIVSWKEFRNKLAITNY